MADQNCDRFFVIQEEEDYLLIAAEGHVPSA